MTQPEKEHSMLEMIIAKRFQEAGFNIILEPNPNLIPFDVGRYRPDILATKEDLNVVVECKSFPIRTPLDKYTEISDLINKERNWKFIVVSNKVTVEDINRLSIPVKERALSDISSIVIRNKKTVPMITEDNKDFLNAIFFQQYSHIDILLADLAAVLGMPLFSLTVDQTAKYLYSLGELDYDLFNLITEVTNVRNSISHSLSRDLEISIFSILFKIQDDIIHLINVAAVNLDPLL